MSTNSDASELEEDFGWRQSAPFARRAAMAVFSWQDPRWSFLWAILAAAPFLLAAAVAPALLSLSSTVDMIAPIAEARAVGAGEARLLDQNEPFYLLLLMAADHFAEAPGRIHLIAKVFGAMLVVAPLAYLASTRFPTFQSTLLTAGLAAYVAAPFAGSSELALAIFLVCAVAFVCAPADNSPSRARFEGLLAGAGLFALWMLNPIFSLAGFIVLSACPFLSGRCGLTRYAAALAMFAVFAALSEYAVPGVNLVRASAASGILSGDAGLVGQEGAMGLSGVVTSAIIIFVSTAIFGGRKHWKSWAVAAGLAILAFASARLAGANALPVFALAAGVACFSVASPFYDGVFRNHDRASVSAALMAASLTLFWTAALSAHSAGQFSLQYRAAKDAPENIRSELALVQPGGPTIAQWIEEGRFSTPEARALFALAPVDQSAMLLEAASRVRVIAAQGVDVAILTSADTACVVASGRDCQADGPAAATIASVVFVPRLDLDPATVAAKGRSEALLYTEFKMVERTVFWEIWVRRGAVAPAGLVRLGDGVLYR